MDRSLEESLTPIRPIAKAIHDAGGRALVVGGFVRDRLLGRESKDLDVEVYASRRSRIPSEALAR